MHRKLTNGNGGSGRGLNPSFLLCRDGSNLLFDIWWNEHAFMSDLGFSRACMLTHGHMHTYIHTKILYIHIYRYIYICVCVREWNS